MLPTSDTPARPTKRFYSLSEVEKMGLGSRSTIFRLRRKGELKTVRIGGKHKIAAEEIERIAAGSP